jgi:hypothetical protein
MADGYTDTPLIPGTDWHVHDKNRPQPRVVTPASDINQPPSDAVVLFDGKSLDDWEKADGSGPAEWELKGEGQMEVKPGTGSIRSKKAFGSVQLHVEFASPAEVKGDSQGRGNSGVFLMQRYEVQVLDNFENPTYPDGTVGAIYGQYPPLVNASRRPGEFQTYDIVFEAPQFEGDTVIRPAFMTVFLNGVLLHHATELLGFTTHRDAPAYQPHPPTAPLELQDHGDLVRFRNIWVRELKGYDAG